MKKSLVTLAVLAATGAFAQSSVTLYGIVEGTADIGYSRQQDATATLNTFNAAGALTGSSTTSSSSSTKNNLRVQDGSDQGTGTSRIGFRGTEDLGGGLKANFQLEMGLRLDDGCTTLTSTGGCDNGGNSANSGGSTFGRNAWGGLSGGFGEVRVGRQVLGSFGVQANSESSGAALGLYNPSSSAFAPTVMGGTTRFSNAIKYITPNFGGFSANVAISAPETGAVPTSTSSTTAGVVSTTNASRRTGVDLALEYANGPAYIGFGYNKRDTGNVTSFATPVVGGVSSGNTAPGTATGYTIGGAYDLGVVKPFVNYTRVKTSTNSLVANSATATSTATAGDINARGLSIGLRAPVGPFTVIAGYGRFNVTTDASSSALAGGVTTTSFGRGEEKRDAFQLGAQYALSKRTLVETNYGYSKLRGNGTATATSNAPGAGSIVISGSSNDRISAFNVGLKHSF